MSRITRKQKARTAPRRRSKGWHHRCTLRQLAQSLRDGSVRWSPWMRALIQSWMRQARMPASLVWRANGSVRWERGAPLYVIGLRETCGIQVPAFDPLPAGYTTGLAEASLAAHPAACRLYECEACSVRDCPWGDELHYHHDGCPSCFQDEAGRGRGGDAVSETKKITLLVPVEDRR